MLSCFEEYLGRASQRESAAEQRKAIEEEERMIEGNGNWGRVHKLRQEGKEDQRKDHWKVN